MSFVGVEKIPGFVLHHDEMTLQDLPWWASLTGLTVVRPGEDSALPRNGGYCGALKFQSLIAAMDTFLPYLETRLRTEYGVQVTPIPMMKDLREVQTLADFNGASVLVNCTGIGARNLCQDLDVVPGRGATVRISRPASVTHFVSTELPELTYILPRGPNSITLGGCLEKNSWDTETNNQEAQDILFRCAQHIPELKFSQVQSTWVGLRPIRESGVRLEADQVDQLPVVHNYGHGGAGVTVCLGCASDVAKLVLDLLH